MVGTIPTAAESAVTEIHDRLASAGTASFLAVDGAGRCARINLRALAALVNNILTDQTATLRAELDEIARESELRQREIVDLIGERDAAEARVRELEDDLSCAGDAR